MQFSATILGSTTGASGGGAKAVLLEEYRLELHSLS